MLARPPTPAAVRACRNARQARWRQRRRDGVMVVEVEVDGAGINWLVHGPRTLDERNAGDPHEVGAAIARRP